MTTQTESDLKFYAAHSPFSDPGKYAYLLEALPGDFAAVSRIVQGLVYHYMAGPYIHGYQPPQERMKEIDTRYVEKMLGRILELDDRPLSEPRPFDKRLVGCCRDFSLVTCAVLRQHGIPARLRYGFASYLLPGYWVDHVIVEAWNGNRWQRFDPQVTDGVNRLELPDTDYATGGRAWQMWRSEGANPALFGLGPGSPELSGVWFIRSRMLLDAVALDKHELLCWDQWGLGDAREDRLGVEQEALLDRLAALSVQGDSPALDGLRAMNSVVSAPEAVTCFSPAVGPYPVSL